MSTQTNCFFRPDGYCLIKETNSDGSSQEYLVVSEMDSKQLVDM